MPTTRTCAGTSWPRKSISHLLPRFIRTCRNVSQFWAHIKGQFGSYQERREYLWKEFRPLLEHLEGKGSAPADNVVATALATLDAAHVSELWQRALERRIEDPEGAITSARTLLESVCKLILDSCGVAYSSDADLPRLYSLTSKELNLAPSQHSEQVFKQILGGCQAVVEGLGAVRNRLGDSHGQGKNPVRPQSRHAELAVNLAGSMATFLVATWQARQQEAT